MDSDLYDVKKVLKTLEEKGVDHIYQMAKGRKIYARAISCYDQLMNDLISSSHVRNYSLGQNRNLFEAEVRSLCHHYISLLEEHGGK